MAGLDGLDPTFAPKLQALLDAAGGAIWINSGYRSEERQAQLYADAVRKYGETGAGHWVAPPGHSRHNMGLAADLGGNVDLAHKLAPQFGLVFPMDWEPWHIEPMGARSTTKDGSPAQPHTTPGPGETNTTGDPYKRADVQMYVFSEMLKGKDSATIDAEVRSTFLMPGAAPAGTGQTGAGAKGTSGGGSGGVQTSAEREQWATDFLTKLGKPITPANIKALVAWQQAESGGGGGRFNPLNTTQGGFAGESDLNSVGVKNFANYQDGIDANIKVINNGRYAPILAALDAGNDPMAVANAISQTPWGTGGLVAKILGGQ